MKPERDDEFCDMDVVVRDSKEVLEEIGLLILEARTPDPSVKGRREGYHCPSIRGETSHLCQKGRRECSLASQVKHHMYCAWQNLIPTYIDVLLFPNCKHGLQQMTIVEGPLNSLKDDYILLERWYIDFWKKRHDRLDGSVSSSFLIQALRSYLHFSQLSSWLLSSAGSLPLSVAYRLSAPGEGVLHQFETNPDAHNFPKVEFSDVGLFISVESLPRQTQIPKLLCQDLVIIEPAEPCPLARKGRTSPKNLSDSKNKDDKESPTRNKYIDDVYNKYEPSIKPKRHSKYEPNKDSKHSELKCGCIKSTSQKSQDRRRSPSPQTPSSSGVNSGVKFTSSGATSGASNFQPYDVASTSKQHGLPKPDIDRNRKKSPSRQIFKDNLLPLCQDYEEHNLQVVDETSKRLHSPKILLATSKDTKIDYTKKKRLNLESVDCGLSWEKDYLSAKIKPVEISEYLTNLQNYSFSHSSHSDNSNSSDDNTPRCKFYIGENCDHKPFSSKTSPEEIDAPLKRQRERNYSFEEVPRKLFAPSLSGSSEIQPAIRTDQSDRSSSDRESENVFSDACSSLRTENGFQNGCSKTSNGFSNEVENGIQSVTNMLDKITVDDESELLLEKSLYDDSGLHFDEDSCDKDLTASSDLDFHDSCLDKSFSLSESQFLANKCDTNSDLTNSKVCHNSPKRAFSVPDYSSDNEVAVTNGFSLCNSDTNNKTSMTKVLNSPTMEDIMSFRQHLTKSASMMFNQRTGLPSQSSPAPTKRKSGRFDYDSSLTDTKAIKYALSCSKLALSSEGDAEQPVETGRVLSTSAPASTNCLLGNFEESILNGRIEPIGAVDGFTAEIGASGSFCPKHLSLPVSAYFFKLSDDNAPSPYLGHINLETLGKRGYHIPKKGTLQVTLFNPNRAVVKMFVVMYDMTDMPPRSQTFIRQRTMYMPVDVDSDQPSYLRYLIHLRFASTKSSKVYLHTDLRLIFARDKFEFDSKVAEYELRSFTEGPTKPKYSPKR